jgi:Fur family ferric uptake transcriptional regulator
MVDVDCAVGDTPCLTPADDSGYEIDEAEVIYWGRCPECVAAPFEQPVIRMKLREEEGQGD